MTGHFVTPGVALCRRPSGEWDRVAVVYTRSLGRLPVRFGGVDRPRGKLKAMAEPMTVSELRLYLRPGSPFATATGGRVLDAFPAARSGLGRVVLGLELCELLLRASAEGSPRPEKYDLIVEHLAALEAGAGEWLLVSFGLKLLALTGVGLGAGVVSATERAAAAALMSAPAAAAGSLGLDPALHCRMRGLVESAVEAYAERPLMSRAFRRSMAAFGRMAGACGPEPDAGRRPAPRPEEATA